MDWDLRSDCSVDKLDGLVRADFDERRAEILQCIHQAAVFIIDGLVQQVDRNCCLNLVPP